MKIIKILQIILLTLLMDTTLFGAFNTVNVSSSTHDVTNPSKVTAIGFSWSQPSTTNGTELNGYYYKLDKNSNTLMDSGNTQLAKSATTLNVTASQGDGDYYFHIAPFATNGDIGATTHFGPIKIDTTSPSTPNISPDGGSYTSSQSVTISSSDLHGYSIYYTLDGTVPTASSTLYTEAISVNSTKTIKAMAIDVAGNESSVKSSSFTINTTGNIAQFGDEVSAGDIIATNDNGSSDNIKSVISVTGSSSLTHYKYKIDSGAYSEQTEVSTKIDISSLSDGQHTISIIGYDGTNWQQETSATTLTFTVDNTPPQNLTFSLSDGSSLTGSGTVTLSADGSDKIYYTIDGTDPTVNSIQSDTLQITNAHNGTLVVKAISYDNAGNKSSISHATYNVAIPPQAPQISPSSGSYTSNKTITISSTTGRIYYTVSGNNPTSSSTLYNAPFTITSTTTIKAIVIDNANVQSQVSSATITITAPPSPSPSPTPPPPTINATFGNEVANGTIVATKKNMLNSQKTFITIAGTNVSYYKYKINNQLYSALQPISKKLDLSNLTDGIYTFYLLGSNGNRWQSSPSSLTFSVDNSAPKNLRIKRVQDSVTITANDSHTFDIYYTTDGSTPTQNSTKYSTTMIVEKTKTIKAIAIDSVGNATNIVTSKYTNKTKNDFNGDGISDIFWRNGDKNSLWFINAHGSYENIEKVSKPIDYNVVGLGDFNGDGKSDILWKSGTKISVWYMNTDGSHEWSPKGEVSTSSIVAGTGDFNGDGIADIMWRKGSDISIWYMHKDGSHTLSVKSDQEISFHLAGIGDFNGDGIDDLLWRNGVGVSVWYMNQDGTHELSQKSDKEKSFIVAGIGDFNGDGIDDLLWRNGVGVSLWYMNTDGTHIWYKKIDKPEVYKVVEIGDFNGDGKDDILWRKDDSVSIWFMYPNKSHQYFPLPNQLAEYIVQPSQDTKTVQPKTQKVKSDFNGDGISDIFWRDKEGNNGLWYMDKDGNRLYKPEVNKPTDYKIVGTGDFNDDGISDILWRRGKSTSLWYMKKQGGHIYKLESDKPLEYKVVGIGDFNGDGVDDVIWRNGTGTSLWYIKKDGGHIYKRESAKPLEYKVVGTGDFNGDGVDDVIWRNGTGTSLWYMKKDGGHIYKREVNKPLEYKIVGIGDFNSDGVDDILWRNGKGVSLWYMKKAGGHIYKREVNKPLEYKVVGIGDFNSDGVDDVLWRNSSGTSFWLIKKQGGHIYRKIKNKAEEFSVY